MAIANLFAGWRAIGGLTTALLRHGIKGIKAVDIGGDSAQIFINLSNLDG